MNLLTLLNEYGIPYIENGKNVSDGWVGLKCPFCGDQSFHLGYSLDENYFSCWRCGSHPKVITLSKLCGITETEAKGLIRKYKMTSVVTEKVSKKIIPQRTEIKYPPSTGSISSLHKNYLIKRGFDPDEIEKVWNIKGTGPYSRLDFIDYKFRIVIPYLWNGKVVSFTARDVTGKAELRYITCPQKYELTEHKSILYGKQEAWKSTGILVEGPTDVWRMGTSSFAVSGIKYTNQQIREIFRVFKRVAVMFDDDPQAKLQASKIVAELRFRGVDAFKVDIEGDPGSMKQEDADYLVKQVIH